MRRTRAGMLRFCIHRWGATARAATGPRSPPVACTVSGRVGQRPTSARSRQEVSRLAGDPVCAHAWRTENEKRLSEARFPHEPRRERKRLLGIPTPARTFLFNRASRSTLHGLPRTLRWQSQRFSNVHNPLRHTHTHARARRPVRPSRKVKRGTVVTAWRWADGGWATGVYA